MSASDVDLWRIDLAAAASDIAQFRLGLTAKERMQADTFVSPELRARYTIDRASLRAILATYLGMPSDAVIIKKGPTGKPYVDAALQFNHSHSEDLAVCAIAWRSEVGVDIERLREFHDMNGVAGIFFTPEERNNVATALERERVLAFFRCWTRKEALLKATGIGIASAVEDPAAPEAWDTYELTPAPSYVGAVVVTHGTIVCESWNEVRSYPDLLDVIRSQSELRRNETISGSLRPQ